MKFQDTSFNGLKVTVGTKSVTHPRTHPPTHAPKAICPINFFKVVAIRGHTTLIGKGEKWTNKGTDKQYVAEFSIQSTICHI